MAAAEENASNPLAAVNNVDLRWQFTSADAGDRHDVFVDGAYMVLPELKLKYELHYNFTDVTGSDENDFEKLVIKPIYFPFETKLMMTGGSARPWDLTGPSSSATKIKASASARIRLPHSAASRLLIFRPGWC